MKSSGAIAKSKQRRRSAGCLMLWRDLRDLRDLRGSVVQRCAAPGRWPVLAGDAAALLLELLSIVRRAPTNMGAASATAACLSAPQQGCR